MARVLADARGRLDAVRADTAAAGPAALDAERAATDAEARAEGAR